jgi:hypothetical protein
MAFELGAIPEAVWKSLLLAVMSHSPQGCDQPCESNFSISETVQEYVEGRLRETN